MRVLSRSALIEAAIDWNRVHVLYVCCDVMCGTGMPYQHRSGAGTPSDAPLNRVMHLTVKLMPNKVTMLIYEGQPIKWQNRIICYCILSFLCSSLAQKLQ